MYEASFYNSLENHMVGCTLCPHVCKISDGKSGFCKVRENHNGILYSKNYGKIAALNLDPIEKKPLYHFHPGTHILSMGSIGCNLKCTFCQNFHISQFDGNTYPEFREYKPSDIAELAENTKGNIGVAYTYNEPTMFFEFMLDTAKLIKERKMVNVMVTNGYINPEPLQVLFDYIDAFSVDLKGFSEHFFRDITSSKLEPVKKSLKKIRDSGKHLEIENLIIPTLNDSDIDFIPMLEWISGELGEETILHINRYYPAYKMNIDPASQETLEELYLKATKYLKYVYIGNIRGSIYGNDTFCSSCGNSLVKRNGNLISKPGINNEGVCITCGKKSFTL